MRLEIPTGLHVCILGDDELENILVLTVANDTFRSPRGIDVPYCSDGQNISARAWGTLFRHNYDEAERRVTQAKHDLEQPTPEDARKLRSVFGSVGNAYERLQEEYEKRERALERWPEQPLDEDLAHLMMEKFLVTPERLCFLIEEQPTLLLPPEAPYVAKGPDIPLTEQIMHRWNVDRNIRYSAIAIRDEYRLNDDEKLETLARRT